MRHHRQRLRGRQHHHYTFGNGSNVNNPTLNDPRNPALDFGHLDRNHGYIRFFPPANDITDHWYVERVDITVNGANGSTRQYSALAGSPQQWLSRDAGLLLHFKSHDDAIRGAGQTTPGQGWQDHYRGVYIDVDTSSAGFATTPVYLVSLGGNGNMWDCVGASAVYNPTPTGFRVYLQHYKDNGTLDPDLAQRQNWHINWIGEQASAAA